MATLTSQFNQFHLYLSSQTWRESSA